MSEKRRTLRGMVYASMFGALTAVGAYIMIPLPPVPITMQTLFVSLAGALLGGTLGALSQVVYILLGVIGLPVFAGGKAGAGVLLGPTGGYLIGFVVGAWVIGKLTAIRRKPGFIWLVCAMSIGIALVYIFGIIQLMIVAKLDFSRAIAVGLLPPLPGDILKIIIAALIALKIRDHLRL
ncbi:MAG: BioY family transporter [Syntrophus sp. (in: bacteria)]|nr:BioY family transporter [Syntrophus sp. (in: bacteria)]